SVYEINDNSWIIRDMLLLSYTTIKPLSSYFWSNNRNTFYILSELDYLKY
ncbi:hypothetical protein BGZ57DRAFT_778074, partial [Hyaloscypha finlandica]